MTVMEQKLIDFANAVLVRMEADKDWDSDTIDAIGMMAIERGLADTNPDGLFRRILRPGRHPFHRKAALL